MVSNALPTRKTVASNALAHCLATALHRYFNGLATLSLLP